MIAVIIDIIDIYSRNMDYKKMIDSSTSFLYVEGLLFNYSQVYVNI